MLKACNRCSFDTTWTDEDGFLCSPSYEVSSKLSKGFETKNELIVNDDYVNFGHLGDHSCFSPCIEFHFESLPGSDYDSYFLNHDFKLFYIKIF